MQKAEINTLAINKIKCNILSSFNEISHLCICERADYGHIRSI